MDRGQAQTQSLCDRWTVHHVAAHVVAVLEVSIPQFTGPLVRLAPGSRGPVPVPRRLLDGLRLSAADLPWTHGTGTLVTGPGQDLMLAMAGRLPGAERPAGPGAPILATRLRRQGQRVVNDR